MIRVKDTKTGAISKCKIWSENIPGFSNQDLSGKHVIIPTTFKRAANSETIIGLTVVPMKKYKRKSEVAFSDGGTDGKKGMEHQKEGSSKQTESPDPPETRSNKSQRLSK